VCVCVFMNVCVCLWVFMNVCASMCVHECVNVYVFLCCVNSQKWKHLTVAPTTKERRQKDPGVCFSVSLDELTGEPRVHLGPEKDLSE